MQSVSTCWIALPRPVVVVSLGADVLGSMPAAASHAAVRSAGGWLDGAGVSASVALPLGSSDSLGSDVSRGSAVSLGSGDSHGSGVSDGSGVCDASGVADGSGVSAGSAVSDASGSGETLGSALASTDGSTLGDAHVTSEIV